MNQETSFFWDMMKLLILLLHLPSLTLGQSLHIKGGVDVSTQLLLNTTLSDNNLFSEAEVNIYTIPGIHVESLFNYPLNEIAEIGLGIRWESEPREQKKLESVGFNTLPLFIAGQCNLVPFGSFHLKVSGRVGYNLVGLTRETFSNVDEQHGGVYYGAGISAEGKGPDPLIWEFLYSVSNVTFNNAIGPKKIEHSYRYAKAGVTVGKRFDY
tara:strand:- start:996 stop:1628 length:633 start_codon:yes stop_codon:yes gene_type:complete